MAEKVKFFTIHFSLFTFNSYLCRRKDECEGPNEFLTFRYICFTIKQNRYMINKATVQQAVEEWLQGKDYFLVDINISADDRIVVEIDHADGVWIEDCADLSRFIEERVSREEEDYELEVGSAGLGQPFKILRQYEIHVGKEVETLAKDGKKYRGTLLSVDQEGFELGVMQKVKEEGKKRPVNKEVPVRFAFGDVTYTKYLIKIK